MNKWLSIKPFETIKYCIVFDIAKKCIKTPNLTNIRSGV